MEEELEMLWKHIEALGSGENSGGWEFVERTLKDADIYSTSNSMVIKHTETGKFFGCDFDAWERSGFFKDKFENMRYFEMEPYQKTLTAYRKKEPSSTS